MIFLSWWYLWCWPMFHVSKCTLKKNYNLNKKKWFLCFKLLPRWKVSYCIRRCTEKEFDLTLQIDRHCLFQQHQTTVKTICWNGIRFIRMLRSFLFDSQICQFWWAAMKEPESSVVPEVVLHECVGDGCCAHPSHTPSSRSGFNARTFLKRHAFVILTMAAVFIGE